MCQRLRTTFGGTYDFTKCDQTALTSRCRRISASAYELTTLAETAP